MNRPKLFGRNRPSPADVVVESSSFGQFTLSHGVAEEMRLLARRQDLGNSSGRIVAICATVRDEGATFVARSLAAAVAYDTGLSVCLVDCDWTEEPGDENIGLAGYLAGSVEVDDFVQPTSLDRLSYVAAGSVALSGRAPAANSQALAELMRDLSSRFDLVLLDVPALSGSAHALAIAHLADESLLVIRQGGVPIERIEQVMSDLGDDHVAGVVLNDAKMKSPAWLVSPLIAG
ncbi:MAG: hypothetical protein AAF081_12520 [Actinomycetota bacterium]